MLLLRELDGNRPWLGRQHFRLDVVVMVDAIIIISIGDPGGHDSPRGCGDQMAFRGHGT